MQNRTLWTHQFASGSSIAACSWHHAQDNIPCPLCVNVTILLPGLIWQLIQNHPSGSGVNTGGVNLSAAGGVDSLSKNLSGTGVGTWDANPLPRLSTQKVTLVWAEEKTFLSRHWSKFLELILTGKEMLKTPQQLVLSCLSHAVHPTHFSARYIQHIYHSALPLLLPKTVTQMQWYAWSISSPWREINCIWQLLVTWHHAL